MLIFAYLSLSFHPRFEFCKLQTCLITFFLKHFWHSLLVSNRCCATILNEEPGFRLFWTILKLIVTSGTR